MRCIICGKEFIPDKFHPKTVTCSKECGRKWYNQRKKKDENKRYRNKHLYGGNYYKVLERDEYKCVKCSCAHKDSLIVHHIDGLGYCSEVKNNNMDNLQTLCRSCHADIHLESVWETKNRKHWKTKNGFGSPPSKLINEEGVGCGE